MIIRYLVFIGACGIISLVGNVRTKKVIALILGGGQGTRLFPLTKYRSKPAVPIAGKYRLIDIPVSNCLHSNLKNIYVLTQFNSESLNNHINNTYRFDYFSRAFVRILAAEQTLESVNWYQGTADAVRKNIGHLDLKGDEIILVLSGDHLYEMDYRDLIDFHARSGADFTVSVQPVAERGVSEFGILKLRRDHGIMDFREKPKTKAEREGYAYYKKTSIRGPAYLASMGVYVFNAKALKKALDEAGGDFGKEIIPHSINNLKGYGYVFDGYWKDVGTIKAFYDVNMEMAAYRKHFSFLYSGSVFTRPRFLPPARVADCVIKDSLLGEGSVITGARITNSIVGLRTIIGKKCSISRSFIMGVDFYEDPNDTGKVRVGIGDGSMIRGAIIDKNARIGKNVIIRNEKGLKDFDGDNYFIRDGIVIVTKNAVIKDGIKI